MSFIDFRHIIIGLCLIAEVAIGCPAVASIGSQVAVYQTEDDWTMDSDYIFTAPDVRAEFEGGDEALAQVLAATATIPDSIVAPIKELGGKIYARCIVKCVIEADGSVSNAEIEKTTTSWLLDEEAVRAVMALPRFRPALVDDKPVRSWLSLPVVYDY